ncbi:17921_t:CDS:1, partial [Rhizophagus irregularis]
SEKEKIYTIVNIKESIIALERDITKIHQNLKTIAREIYYLFNAMAPKDFEKMLRSDIDKMYNSISHIHSGKEIQS